MLTVTLAHLCRRGLWQQWRAIEVETAERARIQSAWILVGALDWSRLILREDSLAQGGDGTDNLSEPWAVPLQEARLSTFWPPTATWPRWRMPAPTPPTPSVRPDHRPAGLLNLRNLAGDKQVDATAQRQFARLFDYLGLPRQQLDSWRRRCCWPRRRGQPNNTLLLPQSVAQLGWWGCRSPPSRRWRPMSRCCRCAPWST
jgi:general secretion pathway protein K